MSQDANYWNTTPLSELSQQEWEMLCDGCGKCCLHKLQDEDTEEVFYTRVACHLLDVKSGRCTDYRERGVGGNRTRVQTRKPEAFYMFSL